MYQIESGRRFNLYIDILFFFRRYTLVGTVNASPLPPIVCYSVHLEARKAHRNH